MQHHQRQENRGTVPYDAKKTKIPGAYWETLQKKDVARLCEDTGARLSPAGNLALRVLGDEIIVDIDKKEIREVGPEDNLIDDDPLKGLMTVVYLLNSTPHVLKHQMISVKDLKDAHFFQGPHQLETGPLIKKFGNDSAGFMRAAERLGAKPLNLADAAYELKAFPKIPLYYLLWEADDEFEARLSILFDRSIECHLSADAIWGIVKMVSNALLQDTT